MKLIRHPEKKGNGSAAYIYKKSKCGADARQTGRPAAYISAANYSRHSGRNQDYWSRPTSHVRLRATTPLKTGGNATQGMLGRSRATTPPKTGGNATQVMLEHRCHTRPG